MRSVVSRTLEAGMRVLGFLEAHPAEGPSFSNALGTFKGLLARAEVLLKQYREGLIAARAASERRMELRRVLKDELFRHLIGVGVVAAKDRAELIAQFQSPRGTHLAFLTAAKGMLLKAEGNVDALVKEGMSETLLEDLRKGIEEFEVVSAETRAGRRAHVGARVELDGITREITERVRLLNGLVRYRFRKDGELLGAWESASILPRSSRAKAVPKPGDGVVPPIVGGAAPAA